MSVADAAYVTVAPLGDVHSAVIGDGHVTSGGVVSTTVTSNEHVDTFPSASVAVTVIQCSPTDSPFVENAPPV